MKIRKKTENKKEMFLLLKLIIIILFCRRGHIFLFVVIGIYIIAVWAQTGHSKTNANHAMAAPAQKQYLFKFNTGKML